MSTFGASYDSDSVMAGMTLKQGPLGASEEVSIGVVAGVGGDRRSVDGSTQGVGADEHWVGLCS